jgi:hypothetical protein
MLISETGERIIRVLLVHRGETFTLRSLAKESDSNLSRVAVEVNRLHSAGYVEKRPAIRVLKRDDLLLFFSYAWSLGGIPQTSFETLDRAPLVIRKIHDIGEKNNLRHAFTMLAGAEIVAPYVVPTSVHFYINPEQKKDWVSLLRKNGIYMTEKRGGSVFALQHGEHIFFGMQKVREMNVVSGEQLYADLFSGGGIFRDAALKVREVLNGSV